MSARTLLVTHIVMDVIEGYKIVHHLVNTQECSLEVADKLLIDYLTGKHRSIQILPILDIHAWHPQKHWVIVNAQVAVAIYLFSAPNIIERRKVVHYFLFRNYYPVGISLTFGSRLLDYYVIYNRSVYPRI